MKYTQLTAAVIGCGHNGLAHVKAYKKLGARMVICDSNEKVGKALAEEYGATFYTDYKEMFSSEKLDLVSVCLPTHLHYGAVMSALDHGINVLCEKPFTLSVSEAEEMIQKADEKGLTLMVGHCLRFLQPYEYLKRCVRDKRFGKLTYLNMYRHCATPEWGAGGWFRDVSLSGGALRDLHIHDTDVVTSILGEPDEVYTTGSYMAHSSIYKFTGQNISVSATASWRDTKDTNLQRGFDAMFEEGSITFCGNEFGVYTKEGKLLNALEDEDFGDFFAPIGRKYIECEISYLCHCITNGIKPELCPPEETLITIRVNQKEEDNIKKM